MKYIDDISRGEIVVNKSRFISILMPFNDGDEDKKIILAIKKEYQGATHYCFAWKKESGSQKFSDDGEPGGTAGKPLLSLLERHELTNSLIVVVRYYGGTNLGASRLLQTYLASGSEATKKAKLMDKISYDKLTISLPINLVSSLNYYLQKNDIKIISRSFVALDVEYTILLLPVKRKMFFSSFANIKLINNETVSLLE